MVNFKAAKTSIQVKVSSCLYYSYVQNQVYIYTFLYSVNVCRVILLLV